MQPKQHVGDLLMLFEEPMSLV